MKVLAARFDKSATTPDGWPADGLPEVAFAGRSNVGKSSMLNVLVRHQGLARVSKTPGRTRLLNFFTVTLERAATKQEVRFCDLPGYGFAKVSKAERARWVEMIETYLREREDLRAVVLIIDGKVGPTADDVEMLAWLNQAGRRAILVATKLDKLGKAQRAMQLRRIEQKLGQPPRSMVGFSSEIGLGREELWQKLLEAAYGP
jgi:GTP-binding protein